MTDATNNTAVEDTGFLTIDEFSQTYKLSPSSVYNELTSKRLEGRKVRGRTLIQKSEAVRWQKACPKWTPKAERVA